MKTVVRRRGMSLLMTLALRRVKKSVKVAEYLWNAAFVFLVMCATSESITLLFASIALLMAATRHRKQVEDELQNHCCDRVKR